MKDTSIKIGSHTYIGNCRNYRNQRTTHAMRENTVNSHYKYTSLCGRYECGCIDSATPNTENMNELISQVGCAWCKVELSPIIQVDTRPVFDTFYLIVFRAEGSVAQQDKLPALSFLSKKVLVEHVKSMDPIDIDKIVMILDVTTDKEYTIHKHIEYDLVSK